MSQDELTEVRSRYGLPEKYLLFISGITPLKNFGRTVQAFDLLAEKYDHHFVVTGFNKFKFKGELKKIQALKNKDKIQFLGFIPDADLPAFYNLADAYIFPSLYEGFGLPVLEAFACGCPVVTSQTGCTREITADAAILADSYDVADIAEKIEMVLNNDELRANLIKRGFERVKSFSWEKCAMETMNIFHSLQSANR